MRKKNLKKRKITKENQKQEEEDEIIKKNLNEKKN